MGSDILPIGMKEMNRIFDVVDDLELSRESIQVELLPAGDGQIAKLDSGKIHIVLPETTDLSAWMPTLKQALLRLGSDDAGGES